MDHKPPIQQLLSSKQKTLLSIKFLKLEEALDIFLFSPTVLEMKKPLPREANWPPQDHKITKPEIGSSDSDNCLLHFHCLALISEIVL